MDKFKNMAKGGWHPERDSGQSGGIRNQVVSRNLGVLLQ